MQMNTSIIGIEMSCSLNTAYFCFSYLTQYDLDILSS